MCIEMKFTPHAKVATDGTCSCGLLQAGGLAEISRGLSVATPPENVAMELHSEGVPEMSVRVGAIKTLRPIRGRIVRRQLTGGVARRLAQPPANFCQPVGLKPVCQLRPSREERFYQ